MPFPDEPLSQRVEVVPYRAARAVEGARLAARLRGLLPGAVGVQHVGSTSVPGLAAKDCIDVMVQVHDLGGCGVAFVASGEASGMTGTTVNLAMGSLDD